MRSGIIALWFAVASTPAWAQAPFYEGKTVTVVIGASGGSLEIAARIAARHLGKHLPGNPNVIVQNMTGAAHLVATNHVYNVAKPDGLTLLAANPNVGIAQLTKVEAARFDLRRFQWLGSTGADGVALSVRADFPIRAGRPQEVRSRARRRHDRTRIERARFPAASQGVRRGEVQAGLRLSGECRRAARHRAQGSGRLGRVRDHDQARRRPRRGAAARARPSR